MRKGAILVGIMNTNGKVCLKLILVGVGPETTDGLTSPPDFLVVNLVKLLLEVLSVGLSRVELEGSSGLRTVPNGVVKSLEDGEVSLLELGGPVKSTTSGSGGAGVVHVVHTVLADKRKKRLGGLLDGFVEGLRGRVAVLPENLVLGKEHTLDTAHKNTTLSVKVRVDLLLKGGLVKVTGTNGDTKGNSLLLGVTGHILVNGNGRVDTTALKEKSSDSSARTLGSNEDDINVLRGNNVGVLLVDNRETVSKVESLALGDKRSNLVPGLRLSGVGEKVHDDGTLVDGLRDVEESLSGNPTVLLSLLPRLTTLSHTDNDLKAVVTGVEGLTVTLRAIADHGKSVILEVVLELVKGPVSTLVDNLLGTGKVESLDSSSGAKSGSHGGPRGGAGEERVGPPGDLSGSGRLEIGRAHV